MNAIREEERVSHRLGRRGWLAVTALTVILLSACGKQETSAPVPEVGLLEAAMRGDTAVVQQHIAAGSRVDERDPVGGGSPLTIAAVFGHTEVVRVLLEAGAAVNWQDAQGSTALHSAAFLGHPEIVAILLQNGADPNVRNSSGATAEESVTAPFEEVRPVYDFLGKALGPLGLELDYEQLQVVRPQVAALLAQGNPGTAGQP